MLFIDWLTLGKVFKARESALTVLFKQQEFATIYNIFLVVLIVLVSGRSNVHQPLRSPLRA